jgi:hypothetical protein
MFGTVLVLVNLPGLPLWYRIFKYRNALKLHSKIQTTLSITDQIMDATSCVPDYSNASMYVEEGMICGDTRSFTKKDTISFKYM